MGKQDDHNRGQADGAKANEFDALVEDFNPFSSWEYKQGFKHGHANKPKEKESDWYNF